MNKQTFQVKLGCDNCGHVGIHDIPLRHEIENYNIDEQVFSHYHPLNKPEDRTFLVCAYCRLPHLNVFWWKEAADEVPAGGPGYGK